MDKNKDNYFVNFDYPDYHERQEVVDLLKLKLDIRVPNHFIDDKGFEQEDSMELDWNLFDIWKSVSNKYLIANEYRYRHMNNECAFINQDPWEDEIEEIRRAKYNTNIWIENARTEFAKLIKVFYCRIATINDYRKHYPLGNQTNAQIQKASNKDAMLLKEMTVNVQDLIYIKIIRDKWIDLLLEKADKFIVKTNRMVGFSGGLECTILLFKIEKVKGLVHSYPIRENEVQYNYMEYEINATDLYTNVGIDDPIEPYLGNNVIDYNFQ